MDKHDKRVQITIRHAMTSDWRRSLRAVSVQVGVIGVGVLANSEAMQWMGFLAVLLIAAGAVAGGMSRDTALTIAEARARLDAIERGE